MSADFGHEPVLLDEVIRWLVVRPDGLYVDATVGGGGHARAILKQFPARLIGLDCDEDAITAARARLSEFGSRQTLVRANFNELARVLGELEAGPVDGVLMDLGVSSNQLNTASRGFSFSMDEPLDMRMDRRLERGAYEVVNESGRKELEKMIRVYGEEKMASRIARAIERKRQSAPIATTGELASLVVSVMPASMRRLKIHPATRTFQAVRMAVNRELDALQEGLRAAVAVLAPGGRLCVISFHSLEDRLVKSTLRDLARTCTCPRDFPRCVCGCVASMRIVTKKAVTPSDAETAANPRSRSARLRVAERI